LGLFYFAFGFKLKFETQAELSLTRLAETGGDSAVKIESHLGLSDPVKGFIIQTQSSNSVFILP
jgi:hypothetical protein